MSSTDQDHADFRRSLRAYLEQHAPIDRVRALSEPGAAPQRLALWRQLCDELGLAGLCLPEAYGGQGAPAAYEAIVLEELGRALTPVPMMASAVLAARLLQESGDADACARWLPSIASGEVVATVATLERPHDWDLRTLETAATTADGQWRITGTKPWVVDGDSATLALVLAHTSEGPGLFAIDLTHETVRREAGATLDPTRRSATLQFDASPAEPIGRPGHARTVVDATTRRAVVALAAEQLGVASQALEAAVDYARSRVQFGRAIGSFQAIKHLLADRYVEVESLRAAVRHTARALDDPDTDRADLALLAHLCQATGTDVAVEATGAAIQVHGGIGFTWEHDTHLYFKRATASRPWLGTSEHHREKVAALMLDATEAQGATV